MKEQETSSSLDHVESKLCARAQGIRELLWIKKILEDSGLNSMDL